MRRERNGSSGQLFASQRLEKTQVHCGVLHPMRVTHKVQQGDIIRATLELSREKMNSTLQKLRGLFRVAKRVVNLTRVNKS